MARAKKGPGSGKPAPKPVSLSQWKPISRYSARKYRNHWVAQTSAGKIVHADKNWKRFCEWIKQYHGTPVVVYLIEYPRLPLMLVNMQDVGKNTSPLHLPKRRPGKSRQLSEHEAMEEAIARIEARERRERWTGRASVSVREEPKKRVPKDLQHHRDTEKHHQPAVPMNTAGRQRQIA